MNEKEMEEYHVYGIIAKIYREDEYREPDTRP